MFSFVILRVRTVASIFLYSVLAMSWVPAEAVDTAASGKGLIYVVTRDTGAFGNVLLSVNGKYVETMVPYSYIVVAVDPGTHTIGSAGTAPGTYTLNTRAGGTDYIQLRIAANGVPEFKLLSHGDGISALSQARKLREVGAVSPSLTVATEAASGQLPRAPQETPGVRTQSSSNVAEGSATDYTRKNAIAIILKGGRYSLADGAQTTDTDPTVFDTSAGSAGGFEVEWRHPKGFSVGGEVFYFRKKWLDIWGNNGTVDTVVFGPVAKYYFNVANVFYPYVGAGFGGAVSAFDSAVWTNSAGGYAYQGIIGAELRFKYFGVNFQVKSLKADVKSTTSFGTTETNKMGGNGQFLGIVFHIPI